MSPLRSPTLSLRATGPLACFTRPELKVERVSYQVITPSAARGLFEAILWKPAIRWCIERIHVLKPITFTSFRRNEVNSRASSPTKAVISHGGDVTHYYADEDRAQRNTVALYDVDYVIDAYIAMTDKSGPSDNLTKFVDMFRRRVEKGQHFQQPYFGCREFPAMIRPVNDMPNPIDDTRDLGYMLWDIDYSANPPKPIFFPAELDHGVLHVPGESEILGGEM